MIKSSIKSIILATCPAIWHGLSSYRFSLLCRKRFAEIQNHFEFSLFPNGEIFVLTGPFKGMRYFNRIVWGSIIPKWIGSYEEELHPIIDEISNSSYETIVDVGGAEGYYAVGLSLMFPSIPVYVFDIDPIARSRQFALAKINQSKNLIIRKSCSHESLSQTLCKKSLMICDIEGFELELLEPNLVPKLKYADILVEIHQFGSKSPVDVRDALISRFQESHSVTLIPSVLRDPKKYRELVPQLGRFSDAEIAGAIDETRDCNQEWLWMRAITRI